MAHVSIFLTSMHPENNKIVLQGEVYASPNNGPFGWTCEHDWDAIAVDVNSMIRDAAVAALAANNINVNAGDKKTVFCSAIDV